jgi:hypothetical protein
VQISYTLKNILSRIDRGEGLIGELTTQPETKQRLTDTLLTTLNKTNAILAHVESGKGLLGKIVYDDKYSDELTASLSTTAQSLQAFVGDLQTSLKTGNGALPALLSDPEGKKKVFALVDNMNATSENLAAFSASLRNGPGLLPRLLNDKQYGDQALSEFTGLLTQLNQTVAKINQGQGSAGRLINDPAVYESINDILIGINESKLLRWLIRNRQQSGIEKRYGTQQNQQPTTQPAPTTTVTPAPATPPATSTSGAAPATTTTGSAPAATTTGSGSAVTTTTSTVTAVPATPPEVPVIPTDGSATATSTQPKP